MKKFKRILITRTDRLGDVILSTPVIENLRAAYPKAHIAFMFRPYTKEVLTGNPFLDEVILYDKYGIHKSFLSTLHFAAVLRKKRFDCAIMLHPTNRVHMIAFLAAIPVRVGWERKMSYLLTKKLPHNKNEGKRHELDYTLDLLGALGVSVVTKNTFFPLSSEARNRIQLLLAEHGVSESEILLVIHPCASCRSKLWPLAGFSAVISRIQGSLPCRVAVVSDKDQSRLCQSLAEANGVIDLRGKLNLAETAALIERADLFISNDSGPVHIAASLGRPVISIFGRNDPGLSPRRWRPLGERSFFFHQPPDCNPCTAHNCEKGYTCLKNIDPIKVAEKGLEMIRKFRDPSRT
jgi:heptosyltransferase II